MSRVETRSCAALAGCLLLLLPLAGCGTRHSPEDWGALTSSVAAFEAEVLAAERARARALVARDSMALDTLLAPDLAYTHSNAVRESKADMQRSVQSGSIRYDSLTMTAQEFGRVGAAVIVTGMASARVQVAPATAPISIILRYTSIYRRRGSGPAGEPRRGWELVAWQSTRVPALPPDAAR